MRTRPRDEDGVQDGSVRPRPDNQGGWENGPEELQDRRALTRLVDLKFLSTQQLRDAVFRGTDLSLIRRWIRRLMAGAWITVFTPPVRAGKGPKYAIPTARALRWALTEKRRACAGTELETIARLLIPTVERAPVRRNADGAPPFFAHHRGIADMLIAFDRPTVETLWSTAWDRMLPSKIGTFTPPQPDGIIVVRHLTGAKHLLFIEHDRGTEKPREFAREKRAYARMTLTPDLIRHAFGVDSFQVLVTIDCARWEQRMEELRTATRAAHYPDGLFGFYDAAYVRASFNAIRASR